MAKVLIIDDDPIFQKMISHALLPMGFDLTVAGDGLQGLTKANAILPDLIISDVVMPNMDGYETVRRLRRNNSFANTPILMLTAQSDLDEKLAGFEAGADDYMTKPFAPAELVARVNTMLRKADQFKVAPEARPQKTSSIIAVHSLRGGSGCSSLAVNTAIGLSGLWGKQTILLDMVLTAGQVALMLNSSLRRTWADLTSLKPQELDINIVSSLVGKHDSGVHFIAAPTFPPEAELLTIDYFDKSLELLKGQYDYIVVDLPHDFREITFHTLDQAAVIVLVTTPELASLRAAAATLETYRRLGYPAEKVKMVLNNTFEKSGLARKNVEAALKHSVDQMIPFDPDTIIQAINYGQPFLFHKPDAPISQLVENFAFMVSDEADRTIPPAAPSKAWQRTIRRIRNM
jgi:pilus assembly protein CpaE